LALAGACAGVAVAVGFLASHGAISAPDLVLLQGQISVEGRAMAAGDSHALDQPLQFETFGNALVRLGDGSRVSIAPGSHASVSRVQGWRWWLTAGRIDCVVIRQSAGLRFAVATPEAELVVVGTELSVAATPDEGTLVTVTAGTVEVTARDSHLSRRLGAGERWQIGAARAGSSPSALPVAASVAATASKAGAQRHADTNIASEVRAEIESGHLDAARELISRGRQGAAGQDSVLAEMGMLEAEACLAERRFDCAIDAYLNVLAKYPRTEQAEMALFASAQLASDHSEIGHDGQELLRRYQRDYPNGRFRVEVLRALDSIRP